MKPQNILVTTYGNSWQIIPELVGYLNYEDCNFYGLHPDWPSFQKQLSDFNIQPVDQVFVIHTDHEKTKKSLDIFQKWASSSQLKLPEIQFFSYKGIDDINDLYHYRNMTDLIFRTVLKAKEDCNGGALILSLTGGRKSMSADMQWASEIFGCHAMLHIADSHPLDESLSWKNDTGILQIPVPKGAITSLSPMVVFGEKPEHTLVSIDKSINACEYAIEEGCNSPDESLVTHIINGLKQSRNLLFNHYQTHHQDSYQTSFSGLQMLGPRVIKQLENEFIGSDFDKVELDMKWLNALPKAELHCHLGGVLDTEGMVRVATAVEKEINSWRSKEPGFDAFLKEIHHHIVKNDFDKLKPFFSNPKGLLRNFNNVPEPLPNAAFLLSFKKHEELLDTLLFGDKISGEHFIAIDFDPYAALGDLQGSGLLKHPATLKKTCEELIQYCRRDNIKYLELRCSPANYATTSFPIEKVFDVIYETLASCSDITFKLIIIASRHRDGSLIQEHVEYVVRHLGDENFADFFAGFDVAGNEKAQSPRDLKKHLEKILNQSIQMTIHAGENVPVNSVWEAVYELNADRIGHGLTLKNDQRLLNRFVNRRITVEMCPSSNYQIIGFRDFRYDSTGNFDAYPFHEYFNKGVRVTLNTDNPGISRTNLSQEYYKVACMTKGGISKWDLLKVMRNSFISSFIPFKEKKGLLLEIERKLVEIL